MDGFYMNFSYVIEEARRKLRRKGKSVDVGRWQAIDISGDPKMITHELFDWSFRCQIPETKEELQQQIKPNLPWAEDHFQERVSGLPLNPGEQYKNWPYFKRQRENDRHRDAEGKHSHTYMERIWAPQDLQGIRFHYGNLSDVLDLLEREPLTRQAYLPIWFPEDTGDHHRQRVPCSLGYHFMVRDNQFHVFYVIRSCDFIRHFRDDIYMAARLGQWILREMRHREFSKETDFWSGIRMGKLIMHIFSLHIFKAEVHLLEDRK